MLVAKFNCPKCDSLLKPTVPQPGGKMIRCPKCAGAIAVPMPDIEEVEEVEEVEEIEEVELVPDEERITKRSVARRSAAVEQEDEEDRPSRRSATRDEEVVEDEEKERPRKRPKRVKKARSGGSGLMVTGLLGAAFLVVGLGVGGYFLFTSKLLRATNPYAQPYVEVADTLSTVKDQASAKAAEPRLLAQGKQLRTNYEKGMAAIQGLNPNAINEAIAEAQRNPAKNKALAEKMERDMEEMNAAVGRVIEEAKRVNHVPGGKELLTAFYAAWGEGSFMVKLPIQMEGLTEKLSQANYDKIQVGMTEQQVLDTLGKFTIIQNNGPGAKTLQYPFGVIEIQNGKVIGKKP